MEVTITSPLTFSHNVELVKTFTISEIIKRWQLEFNIDVKEEFEGFEDQFGLYKCMDSGLLFFEPKIAGSPDIYKKLQNSFEWYYLKEKWEYDVALKELKNQNNIIEIGCGKGTFISKVLSRTKLNIIGLETSPNAVREAMNSNLPVYLKSIADFLKENPLFKVDTFIAFQVLEHISSPMEFLKELISHLDTGGKLILCVPNKNCFYQHSDELLDMPPHHITKWSEESFRYLEKVLPIKINSILTEPLYVMHKEIWLRNETQYFTENKWYGRYLFNRITIPLIKMALKTNLRKLLKGHTLYISMEKI